MGIVHREERENEPQGRGRWKRGDSLADPFLERTAGGALVRKASRLPTVPCRLWVVAGLFSGFALAYMARVVFVDAIVPMSAEFNWSNSRQGHLMGAFYWGYFLTQFTGPLLADRFGGKLVFGFSIMLCCITLPVIPLVAHLPNSLLGLRFLCGLIQGVAFPAGHHILSRWVPPHEKNVLVGLAWSGAYFGTSLSLVAAPATFAAYSWRVALYGCGLLGMLWFPVWCLLTSSRPSEHLFISPHELAYLESSILITEPKATPVSDVPWRELARYGPTYGVVLMHTCFNWQFYTLQTYLPKMFKTVLDMDLHSSIALCLAYFLMGCAAFTSGLLADKMIAYKARYQEEVGVTDSVRRSFIGVAVIGAIVPILIIALFKLSADLVQVLFIVAIGISGLAAAQFATGILEITRKYGCWLMAFSNTVANIPGFLSPAITGVILDNGNCSNSAPEPESCFSAWQIVLVLTVVIYVLGFVAWFSLFTSKKNQILNPELHDSPDEVVAGEDL